MNARISARQLSAHAMQVVRLCGLCLLAQSMTAGCTASEQDAAEVAEPAGIDAPASTTTPGWEEKLAQAVSGSHRTPANVARDQYRHPVDVLRFFGIRPEMTVVEMWAEGGWWTEILAPYLHDEGTYYIADLPSDHWQDVMAKKLASNPDIYGRANLTQFGGGRTDIAPEGSADMILTFRNLHNWMSNGEGDLAFETMYRTLKPGGILGLVEHRASSDEPQDPEAASGYVREDYAIAMAEKAGFELVDRSEINANPLDTKDHPEGVWMLPPGFYTVESDADREKYAAIGESDRFTLKFRKPAR